MTSLAAIAMSDYQLPEEVINEVMSPALLVFPDIARRNIEAIIEAAGGEASRWRPHLKTTKMPGIWRELIDRGIRGFKCATTREAKLMLELLDECSIENGDLLIAYPLLGPMLARAGDLAAMHPSTRVSILCEDAALIDSIPSDLDIFVDVNPQMNRTGVPIEDVERIIAIAQQSGKRFRGVHFYDGHIRDDDPGIRQSRAHALYGQLLEIRALLIEAGCPVGELITSGTLTFEAALAFSGFNALDATRHTISPGTVVFHDTGTQSKNLQTKLSPAAVIMSRVISQPASDVVTCDAGSKSLAAEAGDPCVEVLEMPHLLALTPSEEHLPLQVDIGAGAMPARGEILLLVPRHVCPSVNLAQRAILIEDGEVNAIVEVAGRGHEMVQERH